MKSMYVRFPGGKFRAVTFSYDDGVETDIRLIDIFKRHGLKGTFNINTGLFAPEGTVYPKGTVHRRMSKSQIIEAYEGSGMEVAVHGQRHLFWNAQQGVGALWDIWEDRKELEAMFGTPIRGAAYPYGAYNDTAVEALKNCGILYCRTVKATNGFNLPQDYLRLHPTCHHNGALPLVDPFFAHREHGEAKLFYIWGHSYEFDGQDNWNVIEELAEKLGGREDVWYATNIEIYDYMDAYNRLVTTLDRRSVYNPSVIPVWFELWGKTYCVEPGQTLSL